MSSCVRTACGKAADHRRSSQSNQLSPALCLIPVQSGTTLVPHTTRPRHTKEGPLIMAIQRTRSPAPPPPPPKDTLTSTSSQPSTRPESRYLNSDLAEALKASVHIGTGPKPSTALAPPLTGQPINNNTDNIAVTQPSPNPSVPRRTPSPLPPGAAEGFMPTHGYSRSSPDMSSITQPQLPSQRMAVQNPFEQDEMEPSGTGRVRAPGGVRSAALPANVETQGVLPAGRVRINRATTG